MNIKKLKLISCMSLVACSTWLVGVFPGWGQTTTASDILSTGTAVLDWRNTKVDTVARDSICSERGHILVFGAVTAMGIWREYVDLPNKTLWITHDPNLWDGNCERCNSVVKKPVQAKPDTVVLWIRGKGKTSN